MSTLLNLARRSSLHYISASYTNRIVQRPFLINRKFSHNIKLHQSKDVKEETKDAKNQITSKKSKKKLTEKEKEIRKKKKENAELQRLLNKKRYERLANSETPLTKNEVIDLFRSRKTLTPKMMFQFSRAVRHDPEYIKKRQALEEQMKNQIAKLNDEKHLRKVYRQQKKMNNVLLKKNLSEQLTAIEQMAEQDHMVNQFFRKKPKPYNRNVPVTPENIEGRISKGENIPFHIAQRVFDLAVKREVKGDPAARLEVKSVKRNVTWKDVHNVILKDPKYNKDDVYNSLVPKVMTSFEKLRIATNKAKAPIPLEIVKSFELDLHKALIQERPRNENDLTQMTTLMRNFALVADSKLSADPPITELKGFIQPYILLINLAALTNISHLVTILSHLVHFGMKLPLDLGTYELVVKNLMSQLQFPKLFVFLKEAEGVRGLVGTTHLYKHVYEQIKSRVSSPVRFPSAIDLYHYQQGYDDLLEILTTRGILNQVVPNAEIRMMSHYFKSHDVDTKKRMNKFLEGDENDDDDTAFTDEFKAWLAKNEKANVLESAKNKK